MKTILLFPMRKISGLVTILAAMAFCHSALGAVSSEASFTTKKTAAKKPFPLSNAPIVDLDHGKFTVAGLTNQIAPEWLKPPKDLYRLGPGDRIEIELLGEAGSRSAAVVGPDGKIYYSLLPGNFVWGKSLTETRQVLMDGLQKYLRAAPDVTVTLMTATSKTVWVLGNVQNPGVHSLSAPTTLLDVITMSGGTLSVPGSPDGICDLKRSFVMREGKLVAVEFEKLLRDGDLSQNIYLRANDLVYLRSAARQNVYVLGAVAMPNVVSFSDQITLMGALSTCGGPVEYAYLSQVAIIRGSLVSPQVAEVNLKDILKGKGTDVKLEPGDIVYVPYVPWRKLAQFAEEIVRQFVYTTAANEGYRAVNPNATPIAPSINFAPSP
jgi:protein involved in polysaccharide export with SLBB domain